MIYEDAIEEVKSEEEIIEIDVAATVRLAEVTELSNGKAKIKFYGDSETSTKLYPYIEGYKPSVNDKVAMLAQSNTFIIIGKISTENIENNYKPSASEIANTYLTQSDALSTYLSKTAAQNTYLKQSDATSTYLKQSDATSTYLKQSDATSTYLKKTDATNTYLKQSDATSTYLKKTDATNTYLKQSDATSTYLEKKSLAWSGRNLYPSNYYARESLGMNGYPFSSVYADNFYGTVNSSSDRRVKKAIKTLGRKWLDFFYRLRPTSFKYKDGTSDRTHTGFIAQEVEAAANEVGIDTKDIATIVVDDGRYYLRYEELIAVQTLAIHDLKAQVDDLTARIHDLERTIYK